MKNKYWLLIILLVMIFGLSSCGKVIDEIPNETIIDNNNNNNNGENNNNGNETGKEPEPDEVEFKVSLIYNKEIYIPLENEKINVYWVDDYSQYSATIDNTGFATKKLDGDFNVYIDNLPEGYTYNPNIYTASTDEPTVQIELMKIIKVRGKGDGLYNCYKISVLGAYRSELNKSDQKIYYEFHPNKNGYYYIESMVNVFDDTINPKIDTYTGTFAGKYFDKTLDSGGISKKDGYTKNFRWVVKLTEEQVGSSFTFAVFADSAIGVFPITVDFEIKYMGENLSNPIISTFMEAYEANFVTDEYSSSEYTYINSNGGVGNYYTAGLNGNKIIDGSNFKYNEETGYYHVWDKINKTYGPILCAKITAPCAYYEDALSMIEYQGNSALTVSDGTENYKQFVEIQYAACCNSDGVCYVTKELMEFLQKFSISERLFMDGNGFVEYSGVYASEEDQWLFACGYYQKN